MDAGQFIWDLFTIKDYNIIHWKQNNKVQLSIWIGLNTSIMD